jgi:hypothetical protein
VMYLYSFRSVCTACVQSDSRLLFEKQGVDKLVVASRNLAMQSHQRVVSAGMCSGMSGPERLTNRAWNSGRLLSSSKPSRNMSPIWRKRVPNSRNPDSSNDHPICVFYFIVSFPIAHECLVKLRTPPILPYRSRSLEEQTL